MSTTTQTLAPSRASARSPRPEGDRSLWRIFRLEGKTELLKTVRMPAYSVPAIAFPVVFYCLFGLAMSFGPSSTSMATYLLGSYGAFGVIGAALFSFGVGVAVERGQGWMLLKRASPMPPMAYFTAKIFVALVFSVVIVTLLSVLGAVFGDVTLSAGQWIALGAILAAGALPFCAAGLALGLVSGPNSAPAIVNLVYLPTAFASGLWIPVQALPGFFQTMAPWLPPYHLGQLAYGVFGQDAAGAPGAAGPFAFLGGPWDHVVYLAVFTVLCLAVARLAYHRTDDRLYG